MRNYFALLFMVLSASFTHAQFLKTSDNVVLREKEYVAIEGSPYLFKDWKTGSIKDQSGFVTDNIMIRYDSYRDEVQFMRDGKILVVAAPTAKEFSFNFIGDESHAIESLMFRCGFQIDGYSEKNYFQVVYDGEIKLLKKIKTSFNQETVNSYGTNEYVKKFSRSEDEFLLKDGVAIKLSKNRKDLLSHFGNYEEQMKAYVKKNKLSVKDDIDVHAVMTEYESLIRAAK